MSHPSPPKPKKFPSDKQRRMDQLLDKSASGSITPKERERLEQLVAEAEQLMVENAKRLAKYTTAQKTPPPLQAVPVTVWVTPESAARESGK